MVSSSYNQGFPDQGEKTGFSDVNDRSGMEQPHIVGKPVEANELTYMESSMGINDRDEETLK